MSSRNKNYESSLNYFWENIIGKRSDKDLFYKARDNGLIKYEPLNYYDIVSSDTEYRNHTYDNSLTSDNNITSDSKPIKRKYRNFQIKIFDVKCKSYVNVLLSHIKDPVSGYDFFENYYCKKWTKNHPLSRDEYFWVYLKDSRKDVLIKAKNLGLVSDIPWFEGRQCGITITNNYGNFKVQLCNLNKGKDIDIDFIKNYIPKKWTSNLDISKEDLFWLKIKNKCDITNYDYNLLYNSLLKAKKLGLAKYNSELSSDGKNIYINIKCSDTNNWKTVLLQNISKKVTIKYFLNFKENCKPRFYNPFIMDYNKAIEFSKSENFILGIKEIPITLTENNIDKIISEKSIVFDLYSKKYNKSIYVGECRCGILEFQSLLLYVKNDITETKKRRHIQYGYDINNQPVIDKIWNYDPCFTVRILAEGEEYSSDSVRAYESIWNHECNNGNGCIIKQ